MKDRIKLIRQNAGMTQQEFAKQIGVSRNTIATYETSVRIPLDAIVLSICREFNINETWLRTGEGSMYMEENLDFMLSLSLIHISIAEGNLEFWQVTMNGMNSNEIFSWYKITRKNVRFLLVIFFVL